LPSARHLQEIRAAIRSSAEQELGSGESPLDRLRASLTPKQREFIDDRAHPMRAACCGRRSGKTQAVIRKMLEKCLEKPRSVACYFATTKERARKLVWDCPDGLPVLIIERGLSDQVKLHETDHRIDFENGSVLWIAGCETLADARNWKGLRYDVAALDEAQDWNEEILRYMVDEALKWALMDRWRSAELLVTGTPGPVLAGLFYELCTRQRKGWGAMSWTAEDNPHVDAAGFLSELLTERGLQIDDPIVQREFFGRWTQDQRLTLFQYCAGRNDYVELPQSDTWHHVLGMDVGMRDLNAFCLESWRRYDRTVYIQEAYSEQVAPNVPPVTRFAEIIRGFQQKFGRSIFLCMDTGGLGLFIAEELINREKLSIEPAKKTEKAAAIRIMNDQLRAGRIKVSPRCNALVDQWTKLQIDPKTQIEKPDQACDLADSALYGWRYAHAYLEPKAPDTSPGAQQRALVERVLAQRKQLTDPGLAEQRRAMAYQPRYDGP
jgi:hypothetical protein